jgi:hypothetical protein
VTWCSCIACSSAEHRAHGVDQLGLGEAGQADQQGVSAAEHGDERLLDHLFLAENDVADGGLGGRNLRPRGFRLAHDCVFELFRALVGYRHISCSISFSDFVIRL